MSGLVNECNFIWKSKTIKQSGTECHSEPCPEPKPRANRRDRRGSGEESQRDCFAKARSDRRRGGHFANALNHNSIGN